jgi:hypothetical protein
VIIEFLSGIALGAIPSVMGYTALKRGYYMNLLVDGQRVVVDGDSVMLNRPASLPNNSWDNSNNQPDPLIEGINELFEKVRQINVDNNPPSVMQKEAKVIETIDPFSETTWDDHIYTIGKSLHSMENALSQSNRVTTEPPEEEAIKLQQKGEKNSKYTSPINTETPEFKQWLLGRRLNLYSFKDAKNNDMWAISDTRTYETYFADSRTMLNNYNLILNGIVKSTIATMPTRGQLFMKMKRDK